MRNTEIVKVKSSISITLLITAIIFIADLFVPVSISIGSLYIFGFYFILKESKNTIKVFTTLFIALTIAKFILIYSPVDFYDSIPNEIISVCLIFFACALSFRYKDFVHSNNIEKEQQINLLAENKAELEKLNSAIDRYLLYTITDLKGNITYANNKFCEVSQYTREELMGINHKIMNSGYHSKEFWKNLWSTAGKGKVWNAEVRNKAKDGSFFWVDTTTFPIYDKDGKLDKYFCLRIPIDDKKKYEFEMQKQITELEEMLFFISHRVRKPVATCIGLTEILKEKSITEEEQKDIMQWLSDSAVELDSYTRELTYFVHKIKTTKNLNNN